MSDGKLTEASTENVTPIDYSKDIASVSLEEIFDEIAEGGEAETPVEEPKSEEKKEELTSEPAKEEIKEEEKPAIDPKQLAEEVSEATTKKLLDQLAPDDATKEEKKDLETQIKELSDKAKAEGRELTYVEALKLLSDRTKEDVKEELRESLKQDILKELDEEVKREEEQQRLQAETAKKQAEEQQKAWNSQWDRELATLENAGRLTKEERIEFLTQMADHNAEAKKRGEPEILNMIEFHALHYKPKTEKPIGANAPVNGARRSVAPTNTNEFNYSDIHNASLEDLMGQQ